MKDNATLTITAIVIEYHWYLIIRYRKTGKRLLDVGEPLTSKRFIRLSKLITAHGMKVMEHQAYYEKMELRRLPHLRATFQRTVI